MLVNRLVGAVAKPKEDVLDGIVIQTDAAELCTWPFFRMCSHFASYALTMLRLALDIQSLVLCLVFGGRSTGFGSQFSIQRRFQLWLSIAPHLRRLMLYPLELRAHRIKLWPPLARGG